MVTKGMAGVKAARRHVYVAYSPVLGVVHTVQYTCTRSNANT